VKRVRNFIKFKRGEKETRLDIFCSKLNKKESEKLSDILKNMGFIFCHIKFDSILAFLTGNFVRVKRITKNLENYFGFTWTENPTILGVSKEELDSVLKVGEEDSGSR
jgi:gluconate kinase